MIGGLTPIHQFVHIGDYAMIGGASAVAQDIPPFCLAEGNRASLRGLNFRGIRKYMDREEINTLSAAYKELFKQGNPLQEVAQRLFETTTSEKVKSLCGFIKTSKRGIPFTRKL